MVCIYIFSGEKTDKTDKDADDDDVEINADSR